MRYPDLAFVLLAVAGGALVLYLGRSLTFWHDEWRSIAFDGGAVDYFRPLNEHWSTFHLVLYRATFHVVGLRSYVPYLAEVVVLHLAAVTGAYVLMRRRVGPTAATLVSIPLLLLGSGAENLFWGFQTGFVGSVMFGVWALVFVESPTRRAQLAASLLLMGSLTASGVGLFFLAVVAGRAWADSSLRRRVVVVAPPAALYVLWFVLIGRDGVGAGGPVTLEPGTARFVVRGLVHATERMVGLDHLPDGHLWGLLLLAALVVATVSRTLRGRPAPLASGCLLGLVTMYVLISVVRTSADPGYDHAVSSRFVYVAAFLLVLAVVDLLPVRERWPAWRAPRAAVGAAVVGVGLAAATVANGVALFETRSAFERSSDATRAFVAVALERGDEDWVDREVPRGWMPPISQLVRIVERHGSPLHDSLLPGVAVARPGDDARERALLALVGEGFRAEAPAHARGFVRARVVASRPATAGSGRCVRASFAVDSAVWVLDLPSRARVRVTPSTSLAARTFLARAGGPGRQLDAELGAGVATDFVIPDVGDVRLWTLALDAPPSSGTVMVCVLVSGEHGLRRAPIVTVRRWT